ncbi:MAG: type II toxin-antitoxin system RelE/ParE family toxin [Elusimicrobia bacterium]|nr:type II toxin-antitoxin system RelE/ParE family toxin [Candidatus Liberimonas magnetica]
MFSLRHGDYRVIYEVFAFKKTVLIIRIGHRKDIYR